MTEKLLKSPLEEFHKREKARMVNFSGWEMPVSYPNGIINENIQTRESAGIFDISHMGQIVIKGPDSIKLLEEITPTHVGAIKPGKVKYSFFLQNDGGIIDDLMITNADGFYYLVVNASRTSVGMNLLKDINKKFSNASIKLLSENGMIALQGPKAEEVLSKFFPKVDEMNFMEFSKSNFNEEEVFITRTGYTGEDGFEISAPNLTIQKLFSEMLESDLVSLCGLGARDTLRLEAGLPLYGNELNEQTSPIEAGLSFAISKKRMEEKNFRGVDRIVLELQSTSKNVRVGLIPEGKQPIRTGSRIFINSNEIGHITSGGYGPSFGGPISMGMIKEEFSKPNTMVNTEVRGKTITLKVSELPFVPHKYKR